MKHTRVIILQKNKKVPDPGYSKNPLSDVFVIGRQCDVCLTTKTTSALIGCLHGFCMDTKLGFNVIGLAEFFFGQGFIRVCPVTGISIATKVKV